jgi:hypothetical protein
MLPWDLDAEFGGTSQSIFWDEQAVPQPDTLRGPDWVKDSFLKAFRVEYRQKMFVLNNTILAPANLSAIGAGGLSSFASARQKSVNSQVALGPWYAPKRPVNTAPANGSAAFPGASLATEPYAHTNPQPIPHASTTWIIRAASGTYAAPLFRETSTNDLTSLSIPFERLEFGETYFWKCFFTDLNGHPSPESAETSFLFGRSVTAPPSALLINEVLADNHGSVTNGGQFPDYVEIVNTTDASQDLTAFSLTDNVLAPNKYFFPAGTMIAPHGFLTIWCDDATNSPGLHSGFAINKDGQTVGLFAVSANGYMLGDSITFGLQLPDLSLGRVGEKWILTVPTPDLTNIAAEAGAVNSLKINEWMASPIEGPDWFEIFNPEQLPVALGGLYLSDSSGVVTNTQIADLTFIGAGGFRKFIADKDTGPRHVNFKLDTSSDSIVLAGTDLTVIDKVTFGAQQNGISQGRLLDGSTNIVSFPETASPEASNYLPLTNVVIDEVLSHSDPPLEDGIELLNVGTGPINISGWWLSDSFQEGKKFRIPANSPTLAPGGFAFFTESQFNDPASPTGFALNSAHGDQVYLSAANADGELTGERTSVSFGPAASGVSFGRVPTSMGADFWAQSARTFGAANAGPLVGPIVISEIQYHPPAIPGRDDDAFEYLRLENITDQDVTLFDAAFSANTWRLQNAIEFSFSTNSVLRAHSSLIVVGFDPSLETELLNDFRGFYGFGEDMPILGPYSGKLGNAGDDIELAEPDEPIAEGNSFFVPWVLVDRVNYSAQAPWPPDVAGTGRSLRRVNLSGYGNEPTNWHSAAATVVNARPEISITAPVDGATLGINEQVTFSADASDSDGIVRRVEFFLDDKKVGAVTNVPFSLALGSLPQGTHKFVARAIDNQLGIGESEPVFVTVMNRAPTVALISPINGASFNLPTNIVLEASASDPDGSVKSVGFYASGVLLGSVSSPPYRLEWQIPASGTYVLIATARDDSDASSDSPPVTIHAARELPIAYSVNAGVVGNQGYGNGLGMDFNVVNSISVTRLGVFDSGSDGISGGTTLTAQIYKRSGNSGTLRASFAFNSASPGVLLEGSRFKALNPPMVLDPGSYSIVGYGFDDANPNGNTNGDSPADWSTDDGGGLITFVGASRYGSAGPGVFPATPDLGPFNRYAAATFEYSRALSSPANLTATSANGAVVLTWSASAGASSYNLKRSSTSGGPYSSITQTAGVTYTDRAIINGATYYYVVSAVNAGGESANSAEAMAILESPPNLTASVFPINNDLLLSWPAIAIGYVLQSTTNLVPPMHWEAVAKGPQTNNDRIILVLPKSGGEQYFRLAKP